MIVVLELAGFPDKICAVKRIPDFSWKEGANYEIVYRKLGILLITVTLCRRNLFRLFNLSAIPERTSFYALPEFSLLYTFAGHIQCENAAFIAAQPEELPLSFQGRRCVAILDSSNTALRAAAAQLRMPSLTCGLSGADTFTMSSWQRDRAVISLLRPLTAFDGTVVEPFEVPVAFEIPPDPFDLLACAAVYVMLGQRCPLNQLELWNLP